MFSASLIETLGGKANANKNVLMNEYENIF